MWQVTFKNSLNVTSWNLKTASSRFQLLLHKYAVTTQRDWFNKLTWKYSNTIWIDISQLIVFLSVSAVFTCVVWLLEQTASYQMVNVSQCYCPHDFPLRRYCYWYKLVISIDKISIVIISTSCLQNQNEMEWQYSNQIHSVQFDQQNTS